MAGTPAVRARPPPAAHSSHGDSSDDSNAANEKTDEAQHERKDITKLDSKLLEAQGNDAAVDLYAKLPPDEAEVLKRQIHVPMTRAGWIAVHRYATTNDLIIMAISSIAAIAAGAAMPLMTIVFGNLAGHFTDYFRGRTPRSDFESIIVTNVLYLIYIAIAVFFTTYITTVGFIYTGEHISGKIRERYLAACLRQNIGFFDNLGSGEITTRITADTNLVQDGISEKVGLTLTAVATFICAFVIGFIKGWKLTLILASTVVAIVVSIGSMSGYAMKHIKAALGAYATGGSIVEEVISSIRNTIAFGTQDKLAKQYDVHLLVARGHGFKSKSASGVMMGVLFLVVFWNYGLAFWMGSRFLVDGTLGLPQILTILMAVMTGAFTLGNVGPHVQAFTTALGAAQKIFNTIDRVSPMDPTSDEGLVPDSVEGNVELRHVKHIYPSRPEVTVMEDINLIVPAGKKTALVGASGSGKSTIVGLVERFYDPVRGRVLLDGRDVSTLNLRWLRRQISLVSQEPTLFGTTIFNNIRHGLIGTSIETGDEEKMRSLVVEAAKQANAHDFISNLPDGYQTNVGERGFLLSGGQKQRIAIARAIVSDPKILLLDEATSALDTKSEGVVQAALETAAAGRTTITIAHRLSTIRNADNIVVMAKGCIVEQGTHNDLLSKQGAYYNLVEAQLIAVTASQIMSPEKSPSEDATADGNLILQATKESGSHDYYEDPDDATIAKRLDRTQTQKSLSSVALKGRPLVAEQQDSLWTLIKLITSFNKPELPYMVFGLFWSIISGGANSVGAVFFAKSISYLSLPVLPETTHTIRHNVNFWSLMYFMLGLVMLISYSAHGIAFALCAEKLIHRVRDRAFRTILRQDVEFFDREENSAGALTSFLSTEATHVAGLSGVTLGTLLAMMSTLVSACALSLAIGWKLSLVCISTIPVLLAAGFFRFYQLAEFQRRAKKAYEQSASYACEATSAIRTVASLTREDDVLQHYSDSLRVQGRKSLISVAKTSTLYAGSQSLVFLCLALGFWYGGNRLADREYTMFQFYVCFMAIIFGAQSAGVVFSFAPDMGKAKQAAQALKTLYDRKPTIDAWSDSGASLNSFRGQVEFRDVHFRYPTRPEQPVLRGLNLSVSPGQYIALVGASGCGKSTTIALLERFYDPLSGGIFVDGHDISALNISDYRSYIALVSQEPTLYQGTLRENILLGVSRIDVTGSEIEFACREANIYDFIMSLPDGFGTVVGSKGSMLSGGQKQRIAIARALLRDPKILLLDEATSALDSESEHVVQAALDKAAKGRTTIAVAHRLSTIQKADCIYVFDQGRIVETGRHDELMNREGRYSELVNLQSLGRR